MQKYSNPRRLFKKILTGIIEINARIHGDVFYCRALKGEALDNSISINCDMSVSCFCHDHDNSGYIGDFSKHTMAEIFAGNIACSKRNSLAKGILPTTYCHSCGDLIRIPQEIRAGISTDFVLPYKGLMVENTINCNLKCKCCNRQNLTSLRKNSIMSQNDIQKIALYLKDNKVKSLSFFKLGEPFADSNIYEKLIVIKKYNPDIYIKISTNGALLANDKMREAALMCDYVEFSIDGTTDQMLAKYQEGHDFQKAYENLKHLVQYRNKKSLERPHIEWKYVVFGHNDKPCQINTAIAYAKTTGCDAITFCPAVTPIRSYSYRYRLHPFYKSLGVPSGKGRHLRFEPGGTHEPGGTQVT